MSEACALPLVTPDLSWQRVNELADLVEVFEPGVQVCSWQRKVDPAIDRYLAGLNRSDQGQAEIQRKAIVSLDDQPNLDFLPSGIGRESLVNDLLFLREITHELLGCSKVGLRLARLRRAMCPGWHFDRLGIRLVCTYQGPRHRVA